MLNMEGLTNLKIHEDDFKMEEKGMMTIKDEEGYIMEIKEEEDMKMSLQKEIKWGTMIPLVGGSALGCERAAGNLPQYHLTFGPFANNEAHLRNHWADHQV